MKTFAKVLAATAAATLAAALVACGDDAAPPAPTPTATSPAVQEPSATAIATVTATPSGLAIPGLGLVPEALTTTNATVLPAGWTLFAWQLGCYGCDGSMADFRRWTSDGKTATGEFLFSFTQPSVPASPLSVYTVAFSSDGRQVAAGLCVRGYCGGFAEPSEDAAGELYRSNDFGQTWERVGPLARGAFVAGFLGDAVVIEEVTSMGGQWDSSFILPSREVVEPSGFDADRMVTLRGREPVWVRYGRSEWGDRNHLRSTYQDAAGPISVPLPDTDTFLVGLTGDAGYVWELHPAEPSGRTTTVLAIADRAGKVSRAFRWDGKWWSIRGITDGRHIAGYGDDASLGEPPAPFMIDLETGTLTPLSGLPRSAADTYTYPFSVVPPRVRAQP